MYVNQKNMYNMHVRRYVYFIESMYVYMYVCMYVCMHDGILTNFPNSYSSASFGISPNSCGAEAGGGRAIDLQPWSPGTERLLMYAL